MSKEQGFSVPPPIQDLKLLYAAAVRLSPGRRDWVDPLEHARVYFMVHGSVRITLGDESKLLEKNDLLLVAPGVKHSFYAEGQSGAEYYFLALEGLDFEQLRAGSRSFVLISAENDRERYLALFRILLEEIEQNRPSHHQIAQNILQILILSFMRELRSELKIVRPARSSVECEKVISFIEENLGKPLNLDQLADITHLSKFYLIHTFKEMVGMTPIRYLNFRRIEEAKRLLAATNHSIAKISDHLGFSNQSYFAHRFKDETGVSPSVYRKQARERTDFRQAD